MMQVNLCYNSELDITNPTKSTGMPLNSFCIQGVNVEAYQRQKLQEAGFICVFTEKDNIDLQPSDIVDISMHYFSIQALHEICQSGGTIDAIYHPDGHWIVRRHLRNEKETVTKDYKDLERFVYPWDILDWMERKLSKTGTDTIEKQTSGAYVRGNLTVGEGTEILPGVVIDGNVHIGKNCRIGPNCYLRGTISIGDDCVVGLGVEIKNALIGNQTYVSHLSYIGDSIIGDDVNVGGGTIFSNFRHDGGEHKMLLGEKLISSGRTKLGALVGNHVRFGANTVILPGRIVPEFTWTMPGEIYGKKV
ncbi:MAG: DapH/DapD/GlmU-related protein [Akkermansia sp.]|nr:DapH/DapD/GlmU-related protein [Akkermansia sp.]